MFAQKQILQNDNFYKEQLSFKTTDTPTDKGAWLGHGGGLTGVSNTHLLISHATRPFNSMTSEAVQ